MYYVLTFKYNGVISISKKKCRYGLILPKKAQKLHPVLQKPSVFGNDSDDDEVREPMFFYQIVENIYIFKLKCEFDVFACLSYLSIQCIWSIL